MSITSCSIQVQEKFLVDQFDIEKEDSNLYINQNSYYTKINENK